MKTRSPWGHYVALMASSSLFGYVWLVELMRDVNELEMRRVFPVRQIGVGFVLALIAYFAVLFVIPMGKSEVTGPSSTRTFFIFALAAALLLSPAFLLAAVARRINIVAPRHVKSLNEVAIFLLTFVFFLSFPIVQRRMNGIIQGQR